MPIAVARVITRLNVGGPALHAAKLTTGLEPYGFHTRLFHGRRGSGEGDMTYLLSADADARFVSTLCRPISPADDLRTLIRLYREFRRLRPAIVHTHMAKAGMLGRLAAAAYNVTRGSAPRARIVHTYHGHVLEGYFTAIATRVFIALERLLAHFSDAIVAISPTIRQELLDAYGIGRQSQYRVVPLGFDLAAFAAIDDHARQAARAALDIAPSAPVMTTVGRLTAIKQPQLFLETVARVAAHFRDLVALVAGDGELRAEAEAHAHSLGVAERVRWLGWRRDLPTVYSATDVFLLTSRNEGTPVALIEAMASAVPGVSTAVGGVKDVVDSPQLGVLTPPGDASALAAGVERFLSDPESRRLTGARARAHVLQRYGLDRLVRDIAAMYKELLQTS
jgi:glycosyltransferase involved in cell wall biosynthesis